MVLSVIIQRSESKRHHLSRNELSEDERSADFKF